MKRFTRIITLIVIFFTFIQGEADANPADISFLVVDLKYNGRQGIKICEVQQGSISIFPGYEFCYEPVENIAESFCDFISQYQNDAWFLERDIVYRPFSTTLTKRGWIPKKKIKDLLSDQYFLEKAKARVFDPTNIYDYQGVLFAKPRSIQNIEQFKNDYPAILVVDAANIPYFRDKYEMSLLFAHDVNLAKFKPKWGLYPKKYSDNLAETIINDLGCEIFVIKPINGTRGLGVIIVTKKDLNKTLKKMLKNSSKSAFDYWKQNKSDSFIVEEFVESDPVFVPHLKNLPFDGTLRVICFLSSNQNRIQLSLIKGYWKLPRKALTQKGNLDEKHRSNYKEGYNCGVSPETWEKVQNGLMEAMTLLYKQMLSGEVN